MFTKQVNKEREVLVKMLLNKHKHVSRGTEDMYNVHV